MNDDIKFRLIELAKKYNLLILVLFGSRAKGNFKKDSDYDFAFYTEKKISPQSENKLFNEIISLLKNENVDLININSNYDSKLRFEIFMRGILIYEKYKGLFADLRGRAFIDHNDFLYHQKDNKMILHEKIKELIKQNG
jgi:uncharacterized protein